MKETKVNVWVFNEATIPIPADVVITARGANNGKNIHDKRTKGYKVINKWADKFQFPFEDSLCG